MRGSSEKANCAALRVNFSRSGKSPGGSLCSCCTRLKTSSMLASSRFCVASLPKTLGIASCKKVRSAACTFTSRARLTSSLILETAALRGRSSRSATRSRSSERKRSLRPSCWNGLSQKEPMKTRITSGVWTTEPSDHISAPYTRINSCGSVASALLSTRRTLSSCPWSSWMTRLNSSDMSSLLASKRSSTRSARSINHSVTLYIS
mmetsp:Transcript_14110/g.35846  ORF Transcript_14110/g.35846 Transcript_14110/m.35846 type:complete len:206 (-) Transcript_14110:641-1258(-)